MRIDVVHMPGIAEYRQQNEDAEQANKHED